MTSIHNFKSPNTGKTAIAFLLDGNEGFEYSWDMTHGLRTNYEFDIPKGTEVYVEYAPDKMISFVVE